jgi:hypothetical protein
MSRAPRRITAVQLLRARARARELGPAGLLKAIRSALRPWDGRVCFVGWDGSHRRTYGGRPDRPGQGRAWEGTVPEYAADIAKYSRQVHAKGQGRMVAHGVSRYRGSSDAECMERTAFYADADDVGPFDPLRIVLDLLGVAYVAQTRAAGRNWHLMIPLATSLRPEGEDAPAIGRWKNQTYRPEYGWILGLFSEVAELSCSLEKEGKPSASALGFDAATDRLLNLEYLYCRRTPVDAVPVTTYREGLALDWQALLEATGYTPPPTRRQRRLMGGGKAPEGGAQASPHAGAWERAFDAAGLLIGPRPAGGWFVRCPNERNHRDISADPSKSYLVNGVLLMLARRLR